MGLTAHRDGIPLTGWRAKVAVFSEDVPIYTTREYGKDKVQGHFTLSLWMALLVLLLVWLNVVVWGVYALVAFVGLLV